MPVTDNKFERCEADDPNRCQATGVNQCPFKAVEGFKYCPRHNASSEKSAEKQRASNYRLQIWQSRLNEFAESTQIKSLKDEIGILRLLMEESMNRCQDSQELMLSSGKISDLAMKIDKVVNSCNRLDSSMGMLLDKSAALTLAGQIVEIITRHVPDPTTVDEISGEIITAIASLGGKK